MTVLTASERDANGRLLNVRDVLNADGKLYVLKGSELISSPAIGREPSAVVTLPDAGGSYVLSRDEARLLTADGALADKPLVIKGIDGYPGALVGLPGGTRALLQVVDRAKKPQNKVALLDLKGNRLDRTITTGRKGARIGRTIGTIGAAALFVAFPLPFMMAALAGGWPALNTAEVIFRPDAGFVYVFNSRTDDVTIIEPATGAVVDSIAVGSAHGLLLGPAERSVLAPTDDQLTAIDTYTNKGFQHSFSPESIRGVYADEETGHILVLTRSSLFAIDESGILTNSGERFNNAVSVMLPPPRH